MMELLLVFFGGMLGSSHCVGMCGPFVLTIGTRAPSWTDNLRRQLVYSTGRIFTYSVLGACAGFASWRALLEYPGVANLPALLAILAGGLLIYQGLLSAGVIESRGVGRRNSPCLAASFFASFLTAPGARNAFLAGVLTGMLPCGLVYAFVALAASSTSMWGGATTMATFGLGTVPIMLTVGCGSTLISLTSRQRVLRVAAWSVVLAGSVSLVRGFGYLQFGSWFAPVGCPFCIGK